MSSFQCMYCSIISCNQTSLMTVMHQFSHFMSSCVFIFSTYSRQALRNKYHSRLNREILSVFRITWISAFFCKLHRPNTPAAEYLLSVKKKVKYTDLLQSASNVLPLPISRRWTLQANPIARHSVNTARPRIRVGQSMTILCFQHLGGFHFNLYATQNVISEDSDMRLSCSTGTLARCPSSWSQWEVKPGCTEDS